MELEMYLFTTSTPRANLDKKTNTVALGSLSPQDATAGESFDAVLLTAGASPPLLHDALLQMRP